MSATVTATLVSTEAAVLTPTITDAIQASLAYLNENLTTLAAIKAYTVQVQNYLAQANDAADECTNALATLQAGDIASQVKAFLGGLPTTEPTTTGVVWLNNGQVSVS